jgi:hypothetical protein
VRLIDSVRLYQQSARWHLHALLSFRIHESMSKVVGNWKQFHSRRNGVVWPQGYSDHRLRYDERGEQLEIKIDYIRQNSVVAGLCVHAADWPWVI